MLNLEIRTIDNVIFNDEVASISFFSAEGYVQILPEHENRLFQVGAGDITVETKSGQKSVFFVLDGIATVENGNSITMLVNDIETDEDFSKSMVEEALKRAEAKLDEALEGRDSYTGYEYELLRAQLLKEMSKLDKFN